MFKKLLLSTAVCAVAMGGSTAVHAAPALEEVIVTAQKTEESIQDIPISIQALDASTLEKNAINNLSDIKALVPSLKIVPNPTTNENLLVNIRGISAGAIELTQDTPTAIHINGVYIARGNGLNMATADLERIEILKGPQGTLYGRNATAGAINMITAKPTGRLGFKQQITIAEQNQIISKTSINLPITDTVATKLSYLYDKKDGFIENSAPGGIDFGDREAHAGRFDLRWTPNADLTIDYGYDWSKTRHYSTPGQCMEAATGGSLAPLLDRSECGTSFKDKLAFYGHHPKNDVEAQGHTLGIEWDISDVMTLRSITGYRKFDDNYYGILFGGGPNLTGGVVDVQFPNQFLPAQANHTTGEQISQEFQLLGDIGDTLSYSSGLYLFKERGAEEKGQSAAVVGRSNGNPIFASLNGPRDVTAENSSWAVFAQVTWSPEFLGGDVDIIPGIRYTKDSREATMYERRGGTLTAGGASSAGVTYTGTPISADGTIGIPAEYDNDFSQTSPSLTVQWHVTGDIMTYGKVVKGYKAGGTAIRSSTNQAFLEGFDPETLTSIELGFKGGFFDQRLRVNGAVFQSKYKDQQVTLRDTTVMGPLPQYDIRNAGRSTYTGVELDVMYAITESLRAGINYAWLDFKYDEVKDPVTGAKITQYYHQLVPKHSYSVNLDYTTDVGIGTLNANLSYSFVDDQTFPYQDVYLVSATGTTSLVASTDRRQSYTPDYGVVNGRISLSEIKLGSSGKSSLAVSLWGKNLTDKEYVSYGFSTVPTAVVYQGFWGEPRTFGLDLVYNYE